MKMVTMEMGCQIMARSQSGKWAILMSHSYHCLLNLLSSADKGVSVGMKLPKLHIDQWMATWMILISCEHSLWRLFKQNNSDMNIHSLDTYGMAHPPASSSTHNALCFWTTTGKKKKKKRDGSMWTACQRPPNLMWNMRWTTVNRY